MNGRFDSDGKSIILGIWTLIRTNFESIIIFASIIYMSKCDKYLSFNNNIYL